MKIARYPFIAVTFTLSLAAVAEEHRELGPHEHGVGRLNIAVEGKRVSMELEVPGADIVGFEHGASTKEQKAAVSKAKTTLKSALKVFELPAEARCRLAEAKVAVEAEDHDHDAAGHENANHEGKEEEGHHSEFHATYAIDCTTPEKLTGVQFRYFELFAGARKLDVNLVTEKGQNHYEITRESPKLEFGEIGRGDR
jgi:Protein of unknown function (DUF2796)